MFTKTKVDRRAKKARDDGFIADRHATEARDDGVVRAGLWIGQVGWRHKACASSRRAIAYPPKHKQIDTSTLYARKVAVFGGLAISMFR